MHYLKSRYGVVIPLALILPFTLVTCLDLRNSFMILIVASLPMLAVFRCMEGKIYSVTQAEI